ncbi:MAG: PAS domain-containing protein [Inquilinus sp.]|nr:PAS domain-containing protein [Inquilinus sp.]
MTDNLPDDIADPGLRALFAYWRERCRGDAIPARRDIDPTDFPRLLPNLFLIDVRQEPFALTYRLVGTNLVAHFGFDATGKDVGGSFAGPDWSVVEPDYRAAVFERRPSVHRDDFATANHRRHRYVRLLLPLAGDGHTVDMLLGAAIFEAA